MKEITVKLIPTIDSLTLSQKELDLTDEEMSDTEALMEYINDYHTQV